MQFRLAAAVLGIVAATSVTAQETQDTTETENSQTSGFSTGEPVAPDGEAIGSTYTEEAFGEWEKRCVRTADGNDPCQMYQLITDQNGGSVAEITVFPVAGNDQIVAGATIITPLETLLTEAVTISIDGGQARRYPFTFCTLQGCVARLGLTGPDLDAYKAGAEAQVRIVPAVAPDQEVRVAASLSGFTAAFESLTP